MFILFPIQKKINQCLTKISKIKNKYTINIKTKFTT